MPGICGVQIIFLFYCQTWMLCKSFSSPRNRFWNQRWARPSSSQNVFFHPPNSDASTSKSQQRWMAPPRSISVDTRSYEHGKKLGASNKFSWIGSTRGGSLFSSSSSSNLLKESESVKSTDTSTAALDSQEPIPFPTIKVPSILIADDEAFVKPLPDKRQYRSIRLGSNLLNVLLISDPNTDTEAAAVHLRTGHFHDPVNRAGLAHFHEHCLFLGTHKYPAENEYEDYLNKNGGYSNAYTDMEDVSKFSIFFALKYFTALNLYRYFMACLFLLILIIHSCNRPIIFSV